MFCGRPIQVIQAISLFLARHIPGLLLRLSFTHPHPHVPVIVSWGCGPTLPAMEIIVLSNHICICVTKLFEDSFNRIPFHPGSFTQSSCLAGLLPSGNFPSGCHFINRFSTVSYLAVSYVSYLAGLSNLPGLLPSGFLTYRGISFTRSFSSVTHSTRLFFRQGSSITRALLSTAPSLP